MSDNIDEIITRPGISTEVLMKCGVRRVTGNEAEKLCGKHEAGLWIPFFSTTGSPILDGGKHYGRLRLDDPPPNGGKYHQEVGTKVHAYLPSGLCQLPKEKDLVIVEGEFKAMSLVEAGVAAIGISGFYGWQIKHEELGVNFVSDILFAIMELRPSRILFLGDADTSLNFQFSDAAIKLAQISRHPVLLPRIPFDEPGKGVDDCRDYLKENFEEWWELRVQSAVSINKKTATCSLARMLCEREMETLIKLEGESESEALNRAINLLSHMGKSPADVGKLIKNLAKAFGTTSEGLKASMKAARIGLAASANEKLKDPREENPDWGPMLTKIIRDKEGYVTDIFPSQRYFGKLYCNENQVLYEVNEGGFYQYSGDTGVWSNLTREFLQQRVGDRMIKMAQQRKDYPDLDKKTDVQFLNAVTKQIQGIAEKKAVFTQKKSLIHCASSMIGFRGEEIVEYDFDPEFYSRNRLCLDPDFNSLPNRFLEELVKPAICGEDVQLLQKFIGLYILQDNPAQQFLILTGEAGRGKSQIASIIKMLVGDMNVGVLRTKHLSDRFEIGRLMGKSLLLGSDVKGDFLELPGASMLKAMVGGDSIDVELKHSNGSFSMSGRFNALITCNERLRVRLEGDAGAWGRRMFIIKFEAPAPAKSIADFAQVLFKEEGSRILAWAIEGAQMLLHDLTEYGKIHSTERQVQVVNDLLNESQSLELFVKGQIQRVEGISDLSKGEALDAYAEFCTVHSWSPLPIARQRKELPELILKHYQSSVSNSVSRNNKDTQGWRHIRLISKGELII